MLSPDAKVGDDGLKRQVLIVEHLHRFGANASKELPERGIAGQIEAKRHRVHEQPDQRLDFGEAAIGDRRADDDVDRAE